MLAQPGRTTLLILIAATTAVPSAPAQQSAQTLSQLYHTAWTLRDGAPASIEAIAQTADGFLWLGSGTGLYRFDGVRFELFEPPAHQSMPSANVSELFATQDSGLWVGYRFGGISLLQRGTIRSYGEPDGLPRGSVITIVQDSAGITWVGTTTALARLEEGRWRRVGPDEGLAEGSVSALLVDRRRRLWVSTEAGVFLRADGATRFERVGPPLTSTGVSRIASALQEAPDGSIWGSSQESAMRQLSPSPDAHEGSAWPRVHGSGAMLVDRSGALWLALPRNEGIERVWLTSSARCGPAIRATTTHRWPFVGRRAQVARGP